MTVHDQRAAGWDVHLLLSAATMGLWIPVWLAAAGLSALQSECTECGNSPLSRLMQRLGSLSFPGKRPLARRLSYSLPQNKS